MRVERYSYGPESDHFGDLWLPEVDGPHPVVVNLHGGAWRERFGIQREDRRIIDLTQRGFACWNIEFRRSSPGKGAWPDLFQDVAAGIDYLEELAPQHGLDLERVVFMGYSSGGHLSLWAASERPMPEGVQRPRIRPKGIVDLAGPVDLADRDRRHLADDAVAELFFGTPDYQRFFGDTSPIELVPIGVPQLLVHGELDERTPLDQMMHYVETARAAGDPLTVLILPGISHFQFPNTESPVWHYIAAWIKDAVEGRRLQDYRDPEPVPGVPEGAR